MSGKDKYIMDLNNQPLVSVPVVTYNSSKFVLETLDSIKAQTYQNIELIISDDFSKDNTVELCQKWVEQNKGRFVRTEIITSEINTGVSANLNRAEALCQGEWVKIVDGDDVLLPYCIERLIENTFINPNQHFVFGDLVCFNDDTILTDYLVDFLDESFYDLTAYDQYKRLVIKGNCLPCPTFFYNRKIMVRLGIKNDESIPLCEDYPRWINITRNNQRIYRLKEVIVKYRIRGNSLSNEDSIKFKKSSANVYLKYCFYEQLKDTPMLAFFRYCCVKYFLTSFAIFLVMIFLLKVINKISSFFTNRTFVDNHYKQRYICKAN